MISSFVCIKYSSKYNNNKKKYNNWDDNDEEQEEEINEDNDINEESDYYRGNSSNKVTNSLRSINSLKDVNQKSESLKSMDKINAMNLRKIVNNKIKKIRKVIDKNQQLQSIIHKHIVLKYNSINILIRRRGSENTFNICREVLKICQLPQCAGFTKPRCC
jgi:hypothetical protein